MPGVSPPATTSKAAVAGGLSGAGVLIYIVDRLLADDGTVAANMLTKLSPVLGPWWASYPLLVLVAVIAWIGYDKWAAAQHARALEVAASQAAAASLAASVGEVATGLVGLRGEVHSLRADLRAHAESVDARFTSTDAGLRQFVSAEVTPIRERVTKLERRKPRRPAA